MRRRHFGKGRHRRSGLAHRTKRRGRRLNSYGASRGGIRL